MSSSESGAALLRCTGLDRTTFGERYWAHAPLLTRHATGFTDLLSPADVDELIAGRGIRTPFFRMVKDGKTLAGTTRSASTGTGRITDLVNADAVREAYAGGATLVLQSLHRIHPALVRFCRDLAGELGHATQCNAYVTPPGSQGFAPHHDTHDVFVLQVDGRKRWNVYAPRLTQPLSSQPSQKLTEQGPLIPDGSPPLLSVVLGPGDALYLPRGYIHAAETNEHRSIHLTIGVHAATAYDVLRDVLELAADEPEFRRSLPIGFAGEQLAATAELVASAARWLAALPEQRIHDAVRPRVTHVAGVEPLGMLAAEDALRNLDKHTPVRPRSGLAAHVVSARDERVTLTLPDRELSLPAYVAPALELLLAGPCLAGELGLPVDDAIVLVRRLMREGVVTQDPNGPAG